MNTINTLTVNGQSYALPDPRSVLDDSAASPDSTWSSQKLAAMDASASIVCQAGGKAIAVSDASDRAPVGLKVYGKTTQLTTTGKNLATAQSVYAGANSYQEVAVDGRNCVKFLANTAIKNAPFTFKENTQYIVSFYAKTVPVLSANTTAENAFCFYYTDGTYTMLNIEHEAPWAFYKRYSDANKTVSAIGLWGFNYISNVYVDVDTFQIEEGATATAYEPYTGGIASPNPDYPQALESVGSSGSITVTVSGDTAQQTLTLSTPNGLPGIPVPSGGNYTDETGQQWICDEIDLTRGVYVKRISTVDMGDLTYGFNSDGRRFTAFIGTMMYDGVVAYPVLATCYQSQYDKGYGVSKDYAISTFHSYAYWIGIGDPRTTAPAELKELLAGETLMYVRKTPIETALSAAELAAYAALHTVKPNTTVYNDASAHMELRYVADTKAYIDRKLAALAQEVTA